MAHFAHLTCFVRLSVIAVQLSKTTLGSYLPLCFSLIQTAYTHLIQINDTLHLLTYLSIY